MSTDQALLVIDVQNDFCKGGSLAVQNAEEILPIVNGLIKIAFDRGFEVVATQDFHPAGHGSFASAHGKDPFTMGELSGLPQMLWPDHCIQSSKGVEFHPDLLDVPTVFTKGMDPTVDSYSGFFDNDGKNPTGLHDYLQSKGIHTITMVGLATDYCVKFTALDAKKLGYRVVVVLAGCRGVAPATTDAAIQEMKDAGILVI